MTARRMNEAWDRYYMSLALDLALRGACKTAPNPNVGCVIVKDGRMAGWGFHKACGQAHAETEALRMAGSNAERGTLYVNLEPCSHHGRTPPCAEAIVRAGVSKVVAAMEDPDPRVSGRGFDILRRAGVEVHTGICAAEAAGINRGFVSRVLTGRPWVTLKAAMTLDGYVAQDDGWSKWISNQWSRARGHLLRAWHDAVLVGVGTVVRDDPRLTVRDAPGTSPGVVVLDPGLRIPADANLLRSGSPMVVASRGADLQKARMLENAGASVILLPSKGGRPALGDVLDFLGRRGINSLLVEGGARVLGSFMSERLFDGVSLFVSPRLLAKGMPVSGCSHAGDLEKALSISVTKTVPVEGDLWIEGTPKCSRDS